MKALVYELTAPRTLVSSSVDLTTKPLSDNEILAATEYTVVSPGTELAAWVGKPPLRPSNVYPRLVGYCNVARVIEAGPGAALAPGDYVLTHQSHRSHFRCSAADVLLSPPGLDAAGRRQLACVYLYHLGYVALLTGGYVPGHEVAIVGFGTLGFTAATLAAAFGAEPVVFSGRSAHDAVPRTVRVLPKAVPDAGQWRLRSGLDGFDIVIDSSDAWADYRLALTLARKGGTLVLLGFPGRGERQPDFNPLDSQYLYDKQLSIRQTGYATEANVPAIDSRFTLKRNLAFLHGLIVRGVVDPGPLLEAQIDWRNLAQAYDELLARRAGRYTVMVDWTC